MTDVSKAPARIAGMFDAIAGRYDFLNHTLSLGIDRRWRTRAIRSLALTGRERVLDVCAGTADLAIAAITAQPSAASVIGVDFSGEMLRVGVEKLRRIRLDDRITLVQGDATRIPIADRSVDAITLGFGIRNVVDVPAACNELYRVMAGGGRLAILEFATPTLPVFSTVYLFYTRRILPIVGRVLSGSDTAYSYLPASIKAFAAPDEFVKLLRQAGFTDVLPVHLMGGSVILYTARRGQGLGAS